MIAPSRTGEVNRILVVNGMTFVDHFARKAINSLIAIAVSSISSMPASDAKQIGDG